MKPAFLAASPGFVQAARLGQGQDRAADVWGRRGWTLIGRPLLKRARPKTPRGKRCPATRQLVQNQPLWHFMNHLLNRVSDPSPAVQLNRLLDAAHKNGITLNVMFAYEDTLTRQWARDVFGAVTPLARRAASTTWWKIGEFRSPGVLAGAVSTAMRADVVVVATHA